MLIMVHLRLDQTENTSMDSFQQQFPKVETSNQTLLL